MTGRFAGKVALVTGAAGGIGRATAQAFAREGARVVVSDCKEEEARATAEAIREAGGEALFVPADITRSAQVKGLVEQSVAHFGRLDIAHNNAGVLNTMSQILADDAEEDFDRIMAVNAKGTFLCMKHEIAQMLKQGGGGAIVNTASAVALVGMPNAVPYVASKHAVAGMTKAAALQFAASGIRINAVCPGSIRTPMLADALAYPEIEKFLVDQQPIGRLGTPEEIASAVLWLASDGASFAIGTVLAVDGGFVAR